MTDPVPSVSFDLTGFPFTQATQFVARTYRPAWIKRCTTVGVWVMMLSVLMLFGEVGFDPAKSVPIFVLLFGLAVVIFASKANPKAYAKFTAESPLNSGMRNASLEEAGLLYRNDFGEAVYPYKITTTVVEWSGAVLFIANPYAFIPIPSSAFPTDDARTAFLDAAKRHVEAAKKGKP